MNNCSYLFEVDGPIASPPAVFVNNAAQQWQRLAGAQTANKKERALGQNEVIIYDKSITLKCRWFVHNSMSSSSRTPSLCRLALIEGRS